MRSKPGIRDDARHAVAFVTRGERFDLAGSALRRLPLSGAQDGFAAAAAFLVDLMWADNPILLAEAVGLGSADLSRIEVVGVPIHKALCDFQSRQKGAPA